MIRCCFPLNVNFLLSPDECPELRGSESAVRTCLVQTFAALAPAIARASKAKPNGNRKVSAGCFKPFLQWVFSC
jgi:hypothetical protein